MKIVHLNTNDRSGGAAIAASRLCQAMKDSGLECSMLSLNSQGGGAATVSQVYGRIVSLICAQIDRDITPKTHPERGLYSSARFGANVAKHPLVQAADIVYIHWINHQFLTIGGIEELCKTGKHIVIYMHDMWHITGGCHHSFECDRYRERCTDCPMFTRVRHRGIAAGQQARKLKIFEQHSNVTIVTPSTWLSECARSSAIFRNHRVVTIPNALDTALYQRHDKQFARLFLNLPPDKKLICFGADAGTRNAYKGWSYLQESLAELGQRTDVEVVIFGSPYDERIVSQVPLPVHFTGCLSDDYSLALVYNAVDVFVSPSLADNFPNVIVEAMSCGVPVVGFRVGGIPDLIDHLSTGYLADYCDSSDLARGISYVLDSEDYASLSAGARAKLCSLSSYDRVLWLHRDLILNLE